MSNVHSNFLLSAHWHLRPHFSDLRPETESKIREQNRKSPSMQLSLGYSGLGRRFQQLNKKQQLLIIKMGIGAKFFRPTYVKISYDILENNDVLLNRCRRTQSASQFLFPPYYSRKRNSEDPPRLKISGPQCFQQANES